MRARLAKKILTGRTGHPRGDRLAAAAKVANRPHWQPRHYRFGKMMEAVIRHHYSDPAVQRRPHSFARAILEVAKGLP